MINDISKAWATFKELFFNEYQKENSHYDCMADVSILSRPQAFGSTGLGFSSVGGCALETASVTVITVNYMATLVCVRDRPAYFVGRRPTADFVKSVKEGRLPEYWRVKDGSVKVAENDDFIVF